LKQSKRKFKPVETAVLFCPTCKAQVSSRPGNRVNAGERCGTVAKRLLKGRRLRKEEREEINCRGILEVIATAKILSTVQVDGELLSA